MELNRPFIRLPFNFDAARLAEEATALDPDLWLPHPSGLSGNSAVPLVSREGGANDDFAGRMATTPQLERCPYHRQVMSSFGEVLGRSRLMKLAPGCEVAAHIDFNYHWYSRVRIHVPVITEPEVVFHCGDAAIHMAAGECWIFNSWQRHRVVNGGKQDRIHLVIDTAGSSRFWKLVREMEGFDPERDAQAIAQRVRFVPFDPDGEAPIATEQFNVAPVMAPGEVDALVTELVRDFEACPDNDPALISRYRELLVDFARDWRETWLLHGVLPSGLPRYRELIERTAGRLHPDRRALVTASNGVGVNPVIMQRILRAALMPEELDRFKAGADQSKG